MKTARDIILALGGAAALGRSIDVADGSVRQWQQRDRIPSTHWAKIVKCAQTRNESTITLELLAALVARAPADKGQRAGSAGAAA